MINSDGHNMLIPVLLDKLKFQLQQRANVKKNKQGMEISNTKMEPLTFPTPDLKTIIKESGESHQMPQF